MAAALEIRRVTWKAGRMSSIAPERSQLSRYSSDETSRVLPKTLIESALRQAAIFVTGTGERAARARDPSQPSGGLPGVQVPAFRAAPLVSEYSKPNGAGPPVASLS